MKMKKKRMNGQVGEWKEWEMRRPSEFFMILEPGLSTRKRWPIQWYRLLWKVQMTYTVLWTISCGDVDACLMFDVGCWCILYIHKHIFTPCMMMMLVMVVVVEVTLAEVLSPMIDWEYQRRRRGGKNQSRAPSRQLRTRAWTGTWWTPAMWRHDGDGDTRYIFSEVTGLNRAISAGPPSTKIMLTMSLPMWRFRSTWKYQSNKEEHSSSRLAGKNV